MPHDLPKAYDPTAIEDHWAEYWVREKLFAQPAPAPGEKPSSGPFSILLPPPNVTGNLHMGHMFEHTESDILVRWHRMCGDRVLWVPGTDHAGIATQMLVERQIASEGTTREKMGREAFVERVWEWRRHYGGAILGQMKRLGALGRLGARVLHHGRAALGRGARGLRAAVRAGAHLSRRVHRELVSALPDRPSAILKWSTTSTKGTCGRFAIPCSTKAARRAASS